MLAGSPVAHFGAGMLAGVAGLAALEAWARVIGDRCDGLYIAFDLDAINASEQLSVAMPERGGLSVWTSVIAIRLLASTNNIVGLGATAAMPRSGSDLMKTADVVAQPLRGGKDLRARIAGGCSAGGTPVHWRRRRPPSEGAGIAGIIPAWSGTP